MRKEIIQALGLLILIMFLVALACTCIALTVIGIIKGYL